MRNIGNDVINVATSALLYETFGDDLGIVNIPAVAGGAYGGLTSRQVHDMNRLADGVVIGGGNLFENGQITVDKRAVEALTTPMIMLGLSHGRILGRDGKYVDRTDSLPGDQIALLTRKSVASLVRDHASQELMRRHGADAEVGGCPTQFMSANPPNLANDGRILVSVRHPHRMSVPPALQWRIPEDVRRLISVLKAEFGDKVMLVCHDYVDLEFAAGFPEAELIYFDDATRYLDALRRCRLSVTYRLHAFLPCLSFGVPSIHLSYDERGRAMTACAGMADWDVDITSGVDVVAEVMSRARDLDAYRRAREAARDATEQMRRTTLSALQRFAAAVDAVRQSAT